MLQGGMSMNGYYYKWKYIYRWVKLMYDIDNKLPKNNPKHLPKASTK